MTEPCEPMDTETKPKITEDLVVRIKGLMKLETNDQEVLLKEFADNGYFETCGFEDHIDTVLFYLLNYTLTLKDLISGDLVRMFGDLFAHEEHCFSITKRKERCCKISLKLFRSNWLKVYVESVSKIHSYAFGKMNDQLLDLMYVLFKKTSNRQAINPELTSTLNSLIYNTTTELEKSAKKEKTEKTRKVVLLIILILDGQFQCLLDKKTLEKAAVFLDTNGIRMYWDNLDQKSDAKDQVGQIVKFCRTLIETHRDLKNDADKQKKAISIN